MKHPSKKEIDSLRLALGMTGLVCINNETSHLILVVQSEMKRLGKNFSLKDAAVIAESLNNFYKKSE